jgi:hypothetical protein
MTFNELKTYIIPVDQNIINLKNRKNILQTIEKLSRIYHTRFQSKSPESWGAMYYEKSNKIEISPRYNNIDTLLFFSHELAHRIQHMTGIIPKRGWFPKSFYEALALEYEAERLAYFIFHQYFGHKYQIHHKQFKSYRTYAEIDALREYYGF